jgi:hypothetical protein
MGRSASPVRSSRLVSTLVAALVAAPLVVTGANAEAAMRVGLSGFTGYQGYSMSDINDVISEINDELSTPGDEVMIDELKGDVSFGAGVKLDLNPTWRVYAEYEHLSDNSGGGNLIGSVTLDVSSETFLVGATYFLPSTGKARVGFGGGLGYYDFGGELAASGTVGSVPFSGTASASGTTIGFHGRADLDVAMSPKFHFDAALGYRSASGELEAGGEGTGSDLDWSGVMTRVGFTYFVK